MTPAQQAAAVYDREPCARSFIEDLDAHLLNGYVFSTPDFFAMGRSVWSGGMHEDIIDPRITFPRESWDCWFVYLVAGDMRQAWSSFPFPLPKIGFEKRNRIRYYRFELLETHLLGNGKEGSASNPLKTDFHDRNTFRVPS